MRLIGFNSLMLTYFAISGTAGNSFGTNVSSLSIFVQSAYKQACHALQVYGGAVSVMIGPYAWSLIGTGISSALSTETICNCCSLSVSDTSITNSLALSHTSGTVAVAPI
jgi:hypothetical protein